jgi:hypothetical protein
LQNFRENIEREMTSVSRSPGRSDFRLSSAIDMKRFGVSAATSREALFVNAKRMHAAGRTFGDIAAEIGVGRRTIAKWMQLDDLPDRQRSMLKLSSPLYFQEYLARRWEEGDRVGRRLFHDVRRQGYLGSLSHLERLLSTWRRRDSASAGAPTQPSPPPKIEPLGEARAVDPTTGWQIGRRISLLETDAGADAVRGCKGCSIEGSVAEFCRDATAGDAISWSSYRFRSEQA